MQYVKRVINEDRRENKLQIELMVVPLTIYINFLYLISSKEVIHYVLRTLSTKAFFFNTWIFYILTDFYNAPMSIPQLLSHSLTKT